MKKLYSIILICVIAISISYSQVQTFKYQAVIRDNDGNILSNKRVGLKVSIIQGSADTAVYSEEFNQTSDEFGIINLEIGKGTVLSGNYLTVDWSMENNQLKIEFDINGGRSYSLLGTSPILSVPVANYAVKSGFPAGMIIAFAADSSKIPDGWLLCDGSAISRVTYAALLQTIGVTWGEGDKVNTFNLPDLRGQFLRGSTSDSRYDPDLNTRTPNGNGNKNAPGSMQGDAFKTHTHGFNQNIVSGVFPNGSGRDGYDINNGTPLTITSVGGNETRPKNVYVNYIIKY